MRQHSKWLWAARLGLGVCLFLTACHGAQRSTTMPNQDDDGRGTLLVLSVEDRPAFERAAQTDAPLQGLRGQGRVIVGEALDDAATIAIYVPAYVDLTSHPVLQDGPGWQVVEVRSLQHRAWPTPEARAPYAAVVRQRVASFERWWEAFEDLKDARDRAGIVSVRVSQSTDDPQVVHLYAFFSDPERYAALFRSAELRERLVEGGVIGTPEVFKVKHLSP